MIYRNSGKVSGQPPLNFKNYSGSIQDYLIEGNTSQNGTPTADAPVDVVGCGVRTGNLFDKDNAVIGERILQNSVLADEKSAHSDYIDVTGISTITVNKKYIATNFYFYADKTNTSIGYTNDFTANVPAGAKYCRINVLKDDVDTIMLNSGSTALPYEPYGYRLPITVNGTEHPIYLGQVETTRRIKKYEFTGTEALQTSGSGNTRFFYMSIAGARSWTTVISDRYVYANIASTTEVIGVAMSGNSQIRIRPDLTSTVNDFKSYLSAQYAAGTPVTVWYVLATPETSITNEPLHKISTYADSISKTQSNLPIPTISGQNTLTIPTTISPSNISLTLDQKEIGKIYEGGKREVELSGVPPISFNAIGSQLEDYLIEGNTSQNGTPTPEAPVDVVGCGVRTENVMPAGEKKTVEVNGVTFSSDGNGRYHISGTATEFASMRFNLLSGFTAPISVSNGGQGTLSFFNTQSNDKVTFRFYNGTTIVDSWNQILIRRTTTAYNSLGNKYVNNVVITVSSGTTVDMTITPEFTNDGILPTEFEPYGYKLPFTVNGTEHPIYLGQVQTTRRIGKVVLTGEEELFADNGIGYVNIRDGLAQTVAPYCNILLGVDTPTSEMPDRSIKQTRLSWGAASLVIKKSPGFANSNALKSYLAAQYAAGTPVTVWYVLAEPETRIVNEPLHKIGNYADSVSKTQSNLPIPITTGPNTLSIETTVQPSNITINYNKQTEIAEVYGGIGENHPIYYMNRTIEGTSPIMFKGLGKDLRDYTISGNTIQDGTPTPEAPVDVVGCGEKTANLCSNVKYKSNRYINEQGVEVVSDRFNIYSVFCNSNTTYTISLKSPLGGTTFRIHAYNNGVWIRQIATSPIQNMPLTFTTPNNANEIRVSIVNSADGIIMLNEGSTALPYEPYGYKLPLTVNDTEHPIYLGTVPTTRRIKKLVLTGMENIGKNYSGAPTNYLYYANSGVLFPGSIGKTPIICDKLPVLDTPPDLQVGINTDNIYSVVYLNFGADVMNAQPSGNTAAGLKEYLAQQYAAGTPVTIWYVLAEPETAIVNEPLHEIGDYADTITMAQAGTTIPTSDGDNTITFGTSVQPSSMSITGNIKSN